MERTVSIQNPGCLDEGRISHELIHALGNSSNYFILNEHFLKI